MYKDLATYCTNTAALLAEVETKSPAMVTHDEDGVAVGIGYACLLGIKKNGNKTVAFIRVNEAQLVEVKKWTKLKILAEVAMGADLLAAMTTANLTKYKSVYDPQPYDVALEDGSTQTITPSLQLGANEVIESIEQAKDNKISEIEAAYKTAINTLTSSYTDEEQKTWQVQLEQARAYVADNTALVPALDALATARGVANDIIAAKIIANGDALATASLGLTGKYQKLIADIEASTSVADVQGIAW